MDTFLEPYFGPTMCEGIGCSHMNSDFVPTIDAAEERFIMHIVLKVGWGINQYASNLMQAPVSWASRLYR